MWNESHVAVTNNWSQERIRRMNEQLQEWESYYDSTTTPTKKPSELRVCCLGGDDPTNDLAVFKREGVLCTNIWVLEKNCQIFLQAKPNIEKSGLLYRGVKLEPRNILTFFEDNKTKTCDIIYFDACGSLPSANQETLKVIASIFEFDKLTSPGVLITNFSFPSQKRALVGEPEELEQITYVAKEYLKHKVFNNETIVNQMTEEQIYNDFVTHQVIDMASLLIPASRMVLPSNWDDIFIPIRDFFKQVKKNLLHTGDSTSEVAGSDQDAGKHKGDLMDCEAVDLMNHFYITRICNAMEMGKTEMGNPLCKAWLNKVFPRLTKQAHKQSVCSLLVTSLLFSSFDFFSRFTNEKCEKFLRPAKSPEDKVLMAGLLYGMSAEPSFPVLDKLLRLEYVAKKRQMFCDVFIFDRCSYLLDKSKLFMWKDSFVTIKTIILLLHK